MEAVLYADILFFINFSMDFITLYLTARLTSGPPMGIRALAAAAIGGIYGTAAVALGIDGVIGAVVTGAVSVGIVAVAMGYGGKGLLFRRAAIFWGAAALLGGVMTAICSMGDGDIPMGNQGGITALLFAGSGICVLIMRLLSRFGRRKTVRIRVSLDGRVACFTALCDSGNLAADPMSARPAVLADASVLRGVIPDYTTAELPEQLRKRLRMIPVKGIGGGGMLTGFIPDSVWVIEDGKERRCDAVIAVSDFGGTFFGGYPANAPTAIL